MWIVLVMVMALSGASGINMSIRLGRLDHKGAKQAGYVGICMSSLVCCVISIAVWSKVRYFGMIFSNDTVFLDLFESAKTPFTVTLLLMNVAMAIEKVPYSMGRTTEVFWYGLIASWGGKLAREYRVFFQSIFRNFNFLMILFLSFFLRRIFRAAQVPAVILCTAYWRDDLYGLFTGMAIGYAVLVLLYSYIAFTSDWKKYAELARMRSESLE